MSNAPSTSVVLRYPLGLPAGSVRALLSMLVVGLIIALIIISSNKTTSFAAEAGKELTVEEIKEHAIRIPPYLAYLLFLMLGSYFASQGGSINRSRGESSPLYLPRGSTRVILFASFAGVLAWKIATDPVGIEAQWLKSVDEMKLEPFLALYILVGFFVGILLKTIVGRDAQSYAYQDLIAWFSLICVMGMTVSVIVELVINPTLTERLPLDLTSFNAVLGAGIAFYFGVRS